MKKRIGAFLLAGAMLLSMTGCGGNKASNYKKYVELGDLAASRRCQFVQGAVCFVTALIHSVSLLQNN